MKLRALKDLHVRITSGRSVSHAAGTEFSAKSVTAKALIKQGDAEAVVADANPTDPKET